MSFRGRALVIGSLALSRIWYVASLIHMPFWVHAELARLIFPFFWRGKPDLVAREVVTQPPTAGGFSVVDIKLNVSLLLVQWIRRYASSPSGWVTIFSFWFSNQFHVLLFWPFAPLLSCLAVCLAGSRRVVFSTLLLFSRWFTFPLSLLSCH